MNPDLEALVKALDLYFQELGGPEAENRLADFLLLSFALATASLSPQPVVCGPVVPFSL